MKPNCNEKCKNNIQGARSRACKVLNNVELTDAMGNYYHPKCQVPGKYERRER